MFLKNDLKCKYLQNFSLYKGRHLPPQTILSELYKSHSVCNIFWSGNVRVHCAYHHMTIFRSLFTFRNLTFPRYRVLHLFPSSLSLKPSLHHSLSLVARQKRLELTYFGLVLGLKDNSGRALIPCYVRATKFEKTGATKHSRPFAQKCIFFLLTVYVHFWKTVRFGLVTWMCITDV